MSTEWPVDDDHRDRHRKHDAFGASWLLRKIAALYEAGRPVENPAGLYRRAVEQHWEVNPNWPEFDELRQVEAARKLRRAESGAERNDYFECPF